MVTKLNYFLFSTRREALLIFFFLLFPSNVFAASLSVDPNKGNFPPGCSFNMQVNVDTEGVAAESVDALLLYDPTQLKAESVTNGLVFNDYPGNTIDSQNGKVSIFALSTAQTGFTGKGTLATVKFDVLKEASSSSGTVRFDFTIATPPKTTDSNVINKTSGQDVLSTVNNGTYTFSQGTCADTTLTATPAGAPLATAQPVASSLPNSGTFDNTLTYVFLSFGLITFGTVGLFVSKKRN